RQFEWRTAAKAVPSLPVAIEQVSQPFAIPRIAVIPAHAPSIWPSLLILAWFCGFASVLSIWLVRWWRLRGAARVASPLPIEAPVPVMSSPTSLEPGVFGIFRPILLLPDGIIGRLTPDQFGAILAHELCHIRRRDNLAAIVHMGVEAIFWFHPLVWWI